MQKLVMLTLAMMLVATCSARVNAEPEYSKVPSRMALLGTSKSPQQYSPIIKTQYLRCEWGCCGSAPRQVTICSSNQRCVCECTGACVPRCDCAGRM
jgi:hypothetical protein